MGIAARAGDNGTTTLFTGDTVDKNHPVVEALGACDEFTCRLGLAKLYIDPFRETILRFQKSLAHIMGYISSMGNSPYEAMDKEVHFLDVLVEEYKHDLGDYPKGFPIPGENLSSTTLHVARASCRQFERRLVTLKDSFSLDIRVLRYINRLSDVLYLMAAIAAKNHSKNHDEEDI